MERQQARCRNQFFHILIFTVRSQTQFRGSLLSTLLPSCLTLSYFSPSYTQTHTFILILFRIVTHTHTIDLLLKWWSFRCSRPLQRTFVVRMLISGMPPFAHMHTHAYIEFFEHRSPPARVVMSFCLLQHQQRRRARRERERNVRGKGWRRERRLQERKAEM